MDRVSYSMSPLWRLGIVLWSGFFVAFPIFAFTSSTSTPSWWFMAFWALIVISNGYTFLFRLSYRIELEGDLLRWYTPFRQGAFGLDELGSISSSMFSNVLRFKRSSGSGVIMLCRRGLVEFADEVQSRAPAVTVNAGRYDAFGHDYGWNGFRRGT